MPSLADLRFAAQSLADRINGPSAPAEWARWINSGAQELYGIITSTYQDYNAKQFPFTLAGGASGNTLLVGPGQTVGDFFMPRALWRQVMSNGASPYWATILRLNSLLERNMNIGPTVSPLYGQMPSYWNLVGNSFEVLPPDASAGTYLLTYVPRMPLMTNDTDTIAQYWLSVNAWDEYIVTYAARKSMLKEESDAGALTQDLMALRERIIRECAPRDDSQPGKIADVKRVQRNYGFGGGPYGWGGPGF